MNNKKSLNFRFKLLAFSFGILILPLEKLDAKVILINVFEVPNGKIKEAIVMWEAAKDFLKTQPGYISTKLHQSIEDSTRFTLINIAEWESEESFKNAIAAMKKTSKVIRVEGLKSNPALYKIIRIDD